MMINEVASCFHVVEFRILLSSHNYPNLRLLLKRKVMNTPLSFISTLLLVAFILLIDNNLYSQRTVTGHVYDSSGEPLIGVSIVELPGSAGTITNIDGYYSIVTSSDDPVLRFSFVGYESQDVKVEGRISIDVSLTAGISLSDFLVVGSRSYRRSSTTSPVPVDVINTSDLLIRSGQIEVNQMLHYAAPSFNATKQSGADGADHIDPASLRGLGPDQTLVLINGKRRHQSSLVNIFGSRGRGNTGTDLNAIPATAIKRIEILRDGASAQYGSDAIAGVINIVLEDQTDKLIGSYSIGGFNPIAQGDFDTGTTNTKGNFLDTNGPGTTSRSSDPTLDGLSHKLGLNYGVAVGNDGYLNMTTELISKDKTLRPGAFYRLGMGEASVNGFSFMLNGLVPISDKSELYIFGGQNYRGTDAYAFTRNLPTARAVVDIYPQGFTPRITSIIQDQSISAGVRSTLSSGWNLDFNSTFGKNDFQYYVKGSNNASLGVSSPTDMNAGGHALSQHITGLTMTKWFSDIAEGFNLAFGAEHRTENFIIRSGEPASYGTFDINGFLVDRPGQIIPLDPITGNQRPGGSQGFPGYSPANEVNRSRSNFGLFVDSELDVTNNVLLSAAARYEHYSDFGSTLNAKIASRLKLTDAFSIRASASTGFRAPSLVQLYYNLRFTAFVDGALSETLLAANNSFVAREFGIKQLKQERAMNAAIGLTYTEGGFSATVDAYHIRIKDRIVLTGYFDAPQIPEVDAAAFFVNAVDTRTRGVDVVLNWRNNWDDGSSLTTSLATNFNRLDIDRINSSPQIPEDVLFGSREQGFLKASAPPSKFTLLADYTRNRSNLRLGVTRFAKVEIDFDNDPSNGADTSYNPRIATDVSYSYGLTDKLNFTFGANNIFNIYPQQQNPFFTDGGGYWDSVQMGFSGAFYFVRIGFAF